MLVLFTIFTIDYISLDTTFFRSSVLYISRWILNSEIVDMHRIAINSMTGETRRGGDMAPENVGTDGTAASAEQWALVSEHMFGNSIYILFVSSISWHLFRFVLQWEFRLLSCNVFESDFMKIPIRYLMLCIAKRLAISISVLLALLHSFIHSNTSLSRWVHR